MIPILRLRKLRQREVSKSTKVAQEVRSKCKVRQVPLHCPLLCHLPERWSTLTNVKGHILYSKMFLFSLPSLKPTSSGSAPSEAPSLCSWSLSGCERNDLALPAPPPFPVPPLLSPPWDRPSLFLPAPLLGSPSLSLRSTLTAVRMNVCPRARI